MGLTNKHTNKFHYNMYIFCNEKMNAYIGNSNNNMKQNGYWIFQYPVKQHWKKRKEQRVKNWNWHVVPRWPIRKKNTEYPSLQLLHWPIKYVSVSPHHVQNRLALYYTLSLFITDSVKCVVYRLFTDAKIVTLLSKDLNIAVGKKEEERVHRQYKLQQRRLLVRYSTAASLNPWGATHW